MIRAWYNDNDPRVVEWLGGLVRAGLVTAGDVDGRPIQDVCAADLAGYSRCHFFAGIGGWDYALRLAGWPADEPVWTGSCPCQPFSSAARGRHIEHDMWPEWRRLIDACHPPILFGEQVAHAVAWLDRVCDDMEAMDYTVWAAVLPACSVGQDHVRHRIYLVGYTNGHSKPILPIDAKVAGMQWCPRPSRGLALSNGIPKDMVRLRAYGNAIVPQVAAQFVMAFMEATSQKEASNGNPRRD